MIVDVGFVTALFGKCFNGVIRFLKQPCHRDLKCFSERNSLNVGHRTTPSLNFGQTGAIYAYTLYLHAGNQIHLSNGWFSGFSRLPNSVTNYVSPIHKVNIAERNHRNVPKKHIL